jgi:hypothetical protein
MAFIFVDITAPIGKDIFHGDADHHVGLGEVAQQVIFQMVRAGALQARAARCASP